MKLNYVYCNEKWNHAKTVIVIDNGAETETKTFGQPLVSISAFGFLL